MRAFLARHWRTILGALLGAAGGAAYAHFVGCRTGTCAITSNVWTAAAFFGFTGAVVGFPGSDRPQEPPGVPDRAAR
jgi:hypothetical protein